MDFFLNRYGLIAIKLNQTTTIDQIIQKLGIDLDINDKTTLLEAIQNVDNRIGLYNDNLFLCSNEIFSLFEDQHSGLLARLLTIYNKETICAVYYDSVSDQFGFAYCEKGKRIRIKYGEQNKIWVDFGEQLSIEKETVSEDDINNWIIEKVTNEKLIHFAGKEITMIKMK